MMSQSVTGTALEAHQSTVHLHTAMRHCINRIIRMPHCRHGAHIIGISPVSFGQLDNGWMDTHFSNVQRPVCHSCLNISQPVLSR